VLLCGVLLVLPLEVPELPSELAGKPALLLTAGGVPGAVPVGPARLLALAGALLSPLAVEALPELDAPAELPPVEGAPDVSGVAADPLKPLLPPPRLSGAAGVRTSTPLDEPACEPALPLALPVADPALAGVLPGLEVLCLSHPPKDSAASKAGIHSKARCKKGFEERQGSLAIESSSLVRALYRAFPDFRDEAHCARR
jgi:hypothetical protein